MGEINRVQSGGAQKLPIGNPEVWGRDQAEIIGEVSAHRLADARETMKGRAILKRKKSGCLSPLLELRNMHAAETTLRRHGISMGKERCRERRRRLQEGPPQRDVAFTQRTRPDHAGFQFRRCHSNIISYRRARMPRKSFNWPSVVAFQLNPSAYRRVASRSG